MAVFPVCPSVDARLDAHVQTPWVLFATNLQIPVDLLPMLEIVVGMIAPVLIVLAVYWLVNRIQEIPTQHQALVALIIALGVMVYMFVAVVAIVATPYKPVESLIVPTPMGSVTTAVLRELLDTLVRVLLGAVLGSGILAFFLASQAIKVWPLVEILLGMILGH